MNFLTICQEIADELDLDYPSTVYNATLSTLSQDVRNMRNWCNLAYNTVLLALGKKNEYRESTTSFTTVNGTETYSIPATLMSIDEMSIGNDPPIRILPWTEYDRYKADTFLVTVTGYPDVSSIYKRQIYLYPTPASTYTVNVKGQELMTDLDLDADVPDLALDFHRVIREFAVYFAMDYEGNPRAGTLAVTETGELQGQGGQAARAVNMLKLVRKNSRAHYTEPPRMVGSNEVARLQRLRRVIQA